MTDQTTRPLNLDEIEARTNAATEGPWCTDAWEIYQGAEYQPGLSMWIGETCRGTSTPEQDRADAAFVAAARTDVPALIAYVRRLQDELDAETRALRQERNRYRNAWHNARARAADAEDNLSLAEDVARIEPAVSAAGESGSTR